MSQIKDQNAIDKLIESQPLNFAGALQLLKLGKKMRRKLWTNQIRWIALQKPDENSKMKKAYFYGAGVDHQEKPITLDTEDLLSSDWFIAQ